MRNIGLQSGFKAALLLSAVLIAPASAQTLANLDPSGGWSVTRMKDSKAADYCALSRPYSNSSVLTLARNATKEYSLAVDFQKPTFDPEKPYPLSLQPGLGQLRAYEVLPTSPSTFVVRLGLDEGFLDALAESNELKIQIAKDKYNFKISEFGGGLNDLESCMTGLKVNDIAPAPVKEAKAATPKPEKIGLLDAEPTQAAEGFKAKKMTAAPAMPAPQVKAAEVRAAEVKTPKAETAKAPPAAEPVQIAKAEKIIEAPQKATSIAPKISKAPAEKIAEKKADTLRAEDLLSVSETKSGDVQFKTSKAPEVVPEAPKEPVKETVKTAPAKQAKVEPVKDAPKAASKAKTPIKADAPKVLPAPAPAQKSTAMALAATAATPSSAAIKATERALELQKIQTQKSESQNEKLQQDLAMLQNKNNELRQQVNDVIKSKDVNEAKDEKKRLAKIADLEAKLEAAKADNVMLSKSLDEAKLNSENKLLNEASGDWTLEKATKRYNEAEREIQRLALELESERTSCRARTSQIENMLFDPAVAEKEQISRLMALEKELEAANAQLQDQNTEIERRVAQRLGAEKTETAALKQKIAESQTQIASLQADLSKARQEAQIASTKASTNASGDAREVTALKQQVQLLTRQLGESETALASAQKTRPETGENIAALQKQLSDAKKAEAAARDQAILSKNELDKFRMEMTQTQSTDAQRADRLASLKIENDRLKSQLSLKDKESQTFRNQFATLQQDLAQTKSRLGQSQSKASNDTGEAERLKQEVQSLRQQLLQKDRQHQQAVSGLQQDKARLERTMAESMSPAANTTTPAIQRRAAPAPQVQRQVQRQAQRQAAGFTQANLQALLSSTGVSANIQRQAGAGAYTWNNGNLKGKAQIKPASVGSIDSQIQNYIAQEKAQCRGDFASMPTSSSNRTSYEIACITQAASQSSSVLFFEKEGSFVALSHETDAADMDMAMDARDRMAAQLTTMRTSAAW